ncbi:hypothetical protein [Halosimplex marinum]|uniref:hypothetical protein n=1 Tax=Halosimplex marinum TaxID=3396620 RepID=UPI003F5639DE
MADDIDGGPGETESGPGDSDPEVEERDSGDDPDGRGDAAEPSERADADAASGGVSDPEEPDGEAGRGGGPAGGASGSRYSGPEPTVSLTIEGTYASVFERVDHPEARQHSEVDRIVENLESTLSAVNRTGGGIRSEIYDAVEFELDDPWEIRKYLELLEMHDLIRMQDDRWVPPDHAEQSERNGNSG